MRHTESAKSAESAKQIFISRMASGGKEEEKTG
jgi:hypothetical protein